MSDEPSSKFEKLLAILGEKLELTGREISDILWLAQQYQTTTDKTLIPSSNDETIPGTQEETPDNTTTDTATTAVTSSQSPKPQIPVYAQSSHSTSSSTSGDTLEIKVPDAPGLREPLKLVRAIRPLIQKIDSETEVIEIKPFALLSAKVLKRLGGAYIEFAEEIERNWENQKPENTEPVPLTDFSFEVVTVNRRGEIINRESKSARFFTENLPNDIPLEMVYIPRGEFMMGSPEGEGSDKEKPQHQVTVPAFFMGKFQVTQEQWKAVANLPQVDKELEPEPSNFKAEENQKNNLPVEQVSWYDAEEFCKRLSKHTGKQYRLASEAEWEYACRARTTTQFYFGETITSELANYDASSTFADESKGEYRKKTAPVGQFPPNAFGLYDMHGNVWEWCNDTWHESYEGAPNDGSSRIGENSDSRVLRGGSWNINPEACRSASRGFYLPDGAFNNIGFRVVCGVSPQRSSVPESVHGNASSVPKKSPDLFL